MPQLLVECSDPGLVVSLAEEFEHVPVNIETHGGEPCLCKNVPFTAI